MKDILLNLPEELEPFRAQFEDSVKPFVRIMATAKEDIPIWQSKFGGLPYLPQGFGYPKDASGNFMFLLAQINCKELPEFAAFPSQGILQFYIADEDMYGANFDNPLEQKNFRIIYFQEIDKENIQTDFSFLPEFINVPVHKTHALTFELSHEPVAPEDIEFENIFGKPSYEFFDKFPQQVEEVYKKQFSGKGHKLGGYAFFTQEDPRLSDENLENYQILMQIDSDTEGIQWGDLGIGNFFIKPHDLANFNFSEVLYNWDSP